MSERSTFDPFEQAIVAGLERYVGHAVDPRDASEIAGTAMRPRGARTRVRNGLRRRHVLLIGIAALLLIPAAYIGAPRSTQPVPTMVPPVQPATVVEPVATAVPSDAPVTDPLAFFVRRQEAPQPGIRVFAVRPDGTEALVRALPDTLAPAGTKWSEWGAVSPAGWLALGVEHYGGPWPVILVNLHEPRSVPWVIDDTNIGGTGPRWGPTGLIAAPAEPREDGLIVADPATHAARTVSLRGSNLVGGGPSIVWAGDGEGIVGAGQKGYVVVPLDPALPERVVGSVSDPLGGFGPAMATLRVCSPGGEPCRDGQDGHVERLEADGSARTIWRQDGKDRALSAAFGRQPDEYWISLDHDGGRQVALVHVVGTTVTPAGTINRAATWTYVGAPTELLDHSGVVLWIDTGGRGAAVVAPFDGGTPTFHAGQFAGFAGAASIAATSPFAATAESLPSPGEPYRLPSVDQLVAAEQQLNPGRLVLGSASHDAVPGDDSVHTYEVPRKTLGDGDVYLDCAGPSSVTMTSEGGSATSACLNYGSVGVAAGPRGSVTVSASGDTSWRVVIYSQ
jgi:hypothetical protein